MASYTLKDGTTLTDEAIEEMAGRFEAGEFPGHTTKVVVGRPRISRGSSRQSRSRSRHRWWSHSTGRPPRAARPAPSACVSSWRATSPTRRRVSAQ